MAVADLLGDVIVYCRSEALKYGIPLEEVLAIIMDSNENRLGADGKPIYDENGKFLKGSNYWKPEPKIKELLQTEMAQAVTAGPEAADMLSRSIITVNRCHTSTPDDRFFFRRG
ncbi:hypothetical protein LMG26857_04196 [Achromobacter anxifer]|nr:hypothetical protein LMG26857_04196 [Achromobacter anxifer]